jgi:undecaprenyl-diphosphatase
VRKSFEVALHAGSAPVLALAASRGPHLDLRGVALTLAPAAVTGLLFESEIEERLGSTRSVAIAQIAAGAVMIAADLRPARRSRVRRRDQLAVGLAQAAALVPGVSRSGAAISAARLNGLDRQAAAALALSSALPVTVGATVLKGTRLAGGGVPAELYGPMAAGAAGAFLSALASLPLVRRAPPLRAVGIYRIALGALCLRR